MNILHTPLFATETPRRTGAGFHNVGSGVLRASNTETVRKVERFYGQRCGHLPLDAQDVCILVEVPTRAITSQMAYLSQLFGKVITARTFEDFTPPQPNVAEQDLPLVVPYINVPETEQLIHLKLGAESWGVPGKMTDCLKNKADFYVLIDELGMEGFCTPDYLISTFDTAVQDAQTVLGQAEEVYAQAALAPYYPLGVVMRAAESDGNYGSSIVYERNNGIIVVQDGDAEHIQTYTQWQAALTAAQTALATTVNPQRENRVVISRYVDIVDSPGMSVVLMNGDVISLGWNGQLQKEGSKACVGTSTYRPKNEYMQHVQAQYEEFTANSFEAFLRKVTAYCNLDFNTVRGVANVDMMFPGALERQLQQHRKQPMVPYLAECNPRWTNYTDAIMTLLGANRRTQTIYNMQLTIHEGISTVDKYPFPMHIDPWVVREQILDRDTALQREDARIICRMATNPLGIIFAGNIERAQQEIDAIIARLATYKHF
ncbi:MAG: hypothetical protein E6J34_23095 [Chloroflexi bacterium]|nr:MAG: hypothetical protein E6J34_23095 [Chloroflexota bacterium]